VCIIEADQPSAVWSMECKRVIDTMRTRWCGWHPFRTKSHRVAAWLDAELLPIKLEQYAEGWVITNHATFYHSMIRARKLIRLWGSGPIN
jgi:hypothetical protein